MDPFAVSKEWVKGHELMPYIRWVGCTSHDIIQWFAPHDYKNSPLSHQPSELIIEVNFGHTFNLLDVLAICYSAQQHRRTLSYTLQRFNCYFLCWTILSVLARRVGEWEDLITPSRWRGIVDGMLDELGRIDLLDATQYLALGTCSLIDQDSPNPAGFVFDSLRSELNADACASLNHKIASTLWQKDLDLSVGDGLLSYLETASRAVLEGDAPGSQTLCALLGNPNEVLFPRTDLDTPSIQKALSRGFVSGYTEMYTDIIESAQARYRMEQLERQHRFATRLTATVVGGIVGPLIYTMSFFFPKQCFDGWGVDGFSVGGLCRVFHGDHKLIQSGPAHCQLTF